MAEPVKRADRQDMPKQDHAERRHNFNEVALGYSAETARVEASRCLQCKKAPCIAGCPVDIDIPRFISGIREGNCDSALAVLREKNSLPAVCGRVCPQEDQCEKLCVLAKKGLPVAIGRLERYAADHGRISESERAVIGSAGAGRKVATVGSGPASLTVAGDLRRLGYAVTVFEALHEAGGVLMYGIPEFRLPKAIVQQEVQALAQMGVTFQKNAVVGRTLSMDELRAEFEAIFIASGAGLPYFLGIPGENLVGVYSANEYLTRVNLMKAFRFPEYGTPVQRGKRVGVVGGGNVAMDAARTALRLGAEDVHLIYRRSRAEMPARIEEVENAEEEGVVFHLLTNPLRVLSNQQTGRVSGVECLRMELGEPDSSGRRRPVPVEGSNFVMDLDVLVVAIGGGANPLISTTTPDLKVNRKGYIEADPVTGATNIPGVYAGGDIVTGSATVISAAGAGRRAATAIHAYLQAKKA